MRTLVLALAAACLVLAVGACGGGGDAQSAGPAPSVPAEADAPGAEPLTFELWFIGWDLPARGCCLMFSTYRTAKELGIPHVGAQFAVGPKLLETLVEALIEGASPKEDAYGYMSAIPSPTSADVRLLGVSIENGIATVDLSSDFRVAGKAGGFGVLFGLAQIVYTVTQFPEIEGVRFELDGQAVAVASGRAFLGDGGPRTGRWEVLDRPVTREDYEDALALITVEAPMIGAEVASPVRIAGTAYVHDGTVRAVVLDAAGSVLAERVANVICGAGCRGDYEIEIPFEVSERQSGVIQLRFDDPGCTTPPGCSPHTRIPVTLLP